MQTKPPYEPTAEEQKFMAALFQANAIQIMMEPYYPCMHEGLRPMVVSRQVPANQSPFAPYQALTKPDYTHCPVRHKKPRDGAGRIPASRFN